MLAQPEKTYIICKSQLLIHQECHLKKVEKLVLLYTFVKFEDVRLNRNHFFAYWCLISILNIALL